tara:strand:+ start:1309 stop:1611 length:303 start_codon:yes stop_codon:yes gene_type:complete
MSGKKKQADNEYSPNWGGSRDNSGRPKREYIENVKEIMSEHIDQNTVMQKLGELIDNGDYRAIEMFMKYVHGTPKQTVDLNSSSSVDLNVTLKGLISFDE